MRHMAILKLKNRIQRGGARRGEAWMSTQSQRLEGGGYAVVLWVRNHRRSGAVVALLRRGPGLAPRRRLVLPGPAHPWRAKPLSAAL